MGYKDTDKVVGQTKGDLPIQHYFATFSKEGEVIEEADLTDDATLRMYETMQFDEGRSQAGQIIGSVAASISTMKQTGKVLGETFNIRGKDVKNIIPKPLRAVSRVALQMASAWSGGWGGDLTQSIATGDAKKHGWDVAFDSAWDAGNEEAIYEMLGLGIVGGVMKGIKYAAGKPYMNIDWIRAKIAESGGNLTASQVVDGRIVNQLEGLAEATFGGGRFERQIILNDRAINKYINEFQQNYIEQAGRTLSEFELGRVYTRAVEIALKQHKKVGGQMFDQLDVIIAKNKKYTDKAWTKVDESSILDPAGKNFQTVTQGVKQVEILPVNTKSLKDFAKRELKIIEGIEGGIQSWRYKYYNDILKFPDQISFGAAQKLRSEWLEKGRNFANKAHATFSQADHGATKALTSNLDNAMTGAAARIHPDFYKEFRAANKFWKAGKERMANDLVTGIINLNPERVGAKIFASGNVSEIRAARHALKSAAFFTKGTEGALDFNKTWKQMQQGYLVDLIGKSRDVVRTELTQGASQRFGTDIAGGELNIPALKKLFIDPESMRTFKTAFTKPQRVAIKNFITAIEAAQRRPTAAGTFMVTVYQAGIVLGSLGGAGWAAAGGLGAVAAITITPAMLARAFTNPTVTKWLAQGMHLKPGTREFTVTLGKLANYFGLTPISVEDF